MRKSINLMITVIILLGSLIISILRVSANPVVYRLSDEQWFPTLIFVFIMTLFVELFIIKAFLRKNILNSFKLYKTVFVVNLLTFPPTQVIAFLIFRGLPPQVSFFIFYYVLVELIPISLECLLFLLFYKKMFKLNYFQSPVKVKTILMSTIIANFTTFIIGYYLLVGRFL